MALIDQYDQLAHEIRRLGGGETGELDARALIRYATLAASSHNTQPWKFRVREGVITILPDFSRRCPVVDPDDSHLFRSLGCATENLVLAAAAQGFSAEVRFDPDEPCVIVALERDESCGPTDLFHAIPRRQCTKTAYDGTSVPESELQLLRQAGAGQGVRTLLLLSQDEKEAVIDYVTRGNIAQLSDRAFRHELVSWIRFNPREAMRTGDGLAGRTTNKPVLPTWLARWMIGMVLTAKGQAATDAEHIRSSAGVAVIVAARNDRAGWVEAGRAYQRFALQAAALDIRTAFLNQPIEVTSLRPQFESWLGLDGEHAQLMVRFGHGPIAPFSLRRSVDDVLVT